MPGNGNKGGGGSAGPLSLSGNRKDNILIGSDYGDNIRGFEGNDVLIGKGNDKDGGTDLLIGGSGDDILIGDSGTVGSPTAENPLTDGADRLFGGTGNDQLYGGGGDDELQGGDGLDILDGGSGFDLALYSADDEAIVVTPTASGFTIDFVGGLPTEVAVNIEGIVGTYYDDVLNGAADRMNSLNGYYGDDTINGGGLTDWLDGHGDNDTIDGKGGDDVIAGGTGNDDLTGGEGADTFVYYSAWDGADLIHDFNAAQGDTIDLTVLNLTQDGTVDPVADGFVFTDVTGTTLFVDLDGGGAGGGDDLLLATTGGGVIDVSNDVLV